jgi:hypothetical protein
MKISALFILFFLIWSSAYSEGFITVNKLKMELTGFVRNDFIHDTHRNVDACDRLLEFFPVRPVYDTNGKDIYATPNAQLLNTFTRFGTRFTGLELGKAKVSAYVEVDFTGFSETNGLRFRHAYTNFAWEKTTLLVGRAWHPTFIEKVFPSVLNENTGLPFQVFNRTPQIRLTHRLADNLDFIAGAVYQYNYANSGPSGKTYKYQRDAVIPNLHGQLQYFDNKWVAGVAIDWKSIQPRISTSGSSGTFKTSQKLNTWAALAYLKYTNNKFEFKGKSMFGQNVSESLLPGGYVVATFDPSTGAETYTPLNHVYNWINFIYGEKIKFGFYAGYLKNLGTSEDPLPGGDFYGMATDIDMIYKLSPQMVYDSKNFMFGWELSLTTAAYGQNDYSDKGRVKNTDNVTNLRNMVSIAYKF